MFFCHQKSSTNFNFCPNRLVVNSNFQVYGLKSGGFGRLDTESFSRIEPGSFARIDPLLSLEIEEELLRYEDLETILPSQPINPTHILSSREVCREYRI